MTEQSVLEFHSYPSWSCT